VVHINLFFIVDKKIILQNKNIKYIYNKKKLLYIIVIKYIIDYE